MIRMATRDMFGNAKGVYDWQEGVWSIGSADRNLFLYLSCSYMAVCISLS